MNTPARISRTGRTMAIIAWILGIVLLARFFGDYQESQFNPNQSPISSLEHDDVVVSLIANRQGHYIANGLINALPATFMLDTGATDVVIPEDLAHAYGLPSQGQGWGLTANGRVKVTRTTINTLSIGDITLYNVRASINPGMNKAQPILLGMSALQQLELSQTEGELTLIQTQKSAL